MLIKKCGILFVILIGMVSINARSMTFDLKVYYSPDPDKTRMETTMFGCPVVIDYFKDEESIRAVFTFDKKGRSIRFSVPMLQEVSKKNAEDVKSVDDDSKPRQLRKCMFSSSLTGAV